MQIRGSGTGRGLLRPGPAQASPILGKVPLRPFGFSYEGKSYLDDVLLRPIPFRPAHCNGPGVRVAGSWVRRVWVGDGSVGPAGQYAVPALNVPPGRRTPCSCLVPGSSCSRELSSSCWDSLRHQVSVEQNRNQGERGAQSSSHHYKQKKNLCVGGATCLAWRVSRAGSSSLCELERTLDMAVE